MSNVDQQTYKLNLFLIGFATVILFWLVITPSMSAAATTPCVSGSAGLYWPETDGETHLVSDIVPGRLIGDLSVILKQRRTLNLVTKEDCMFLRIGASELMAVIENDGMAASTLMRSVADNLSGAVDSLHTMRKYASERGVDFSEFDKNKGS